jgi:amidase
MFINADTNPDNWEPIQARESVVAQWRKARAALEQIGAEVVEVDFPAVTEYERDGVGGAALARTGVVPKSFPQAELWALSMFAWDDFLKANADPNLQALADVEGKKIFPHPTGAVPDPSHQRNLAIDLSEYPRLAREQGITPLEKIPDLAEGIRGLERFRQERYDAWLEEHRLDALVFPTLADIAPADADTNAASAAIAFRNGTWVANGNLVIRHLGIPTVTVPMGMLGDIDMPIGLTFAARPYEDTKLLRYAYAFEQSASWRQVPPRTPALPGDVFPSGGAVAPTGRQASSYGYRLGAKTTDRPDGMIAIEIEGETEAPRVRLFINGLPLEVTRDGITFTARCTLPAKAKRPLHSEWRETYGHLVVMIADGGPSLPIAGYFAIDGVG